MPKTSDAMVILEQRFGPRDPKLSAVIREQLNIAQKLYDLRTERGLSQAEVAALVGTTEIVISSMEESDYNLRRSRQILDKVAKALGADLPLSFTPGAAAGTA